MSAWNLRLHLRLRLLPAAACLQAYVDIKHARARRSGMMVWINGAFLCVLLAHGHGHAVLYSDDYTLIGQNRHAADGTQQTSPACVIRCGVLACALMLAVASYSSVGSA